MIHDIIKVFIIYIASFMQVEGGEEVVQDKIGYQGLLWLCLSAIIIIILTFFQCHGLDCNKRVKGA